MRTRLIVLGVVLLMILGGIPAVFGQQRPEIRARLQFSPARNLDPVYRTRAADFFVYYNIYSHLVRWKAGTAELEGELAERWEVSSDGRVWTFYLRKGIQFHKGFGELTADDVKFTFERFTDKEVASPNASDMANVERIDTPDRYTVRFTLKEPSFVFAANPIASKAEMIVSKKAVLQKGKNYGRDPIGTGPFVFEQWTNADEITLVANDRYFRGRPSIGRLTFVPILEEAVAVAALQRGDVQVIWSRGSAEALQVLRADKNISVDVARRISAVRSLALNQTYPPLRDLRVRQAIAYAVNKKELELGSGDTLRALDHILVDTPWLRDAARTGEIPVYRYDPARAKRLLADAGQSNMHLILTFALRSPDPLIAQIVGEQLRRIGINVELQGVEQTAWNTKVLPQGLFQITPRGLGRGLDPDELARDQLYTKSFPPGDNVVRYDKADALIDAAARERDPLKRRAIYIRLMKQVLTDLPYVPLAVDTLVAAWRAPIKTMITGIDNDFQGYTIEVVR